MSNKGLFAGLGIAGLTWSWLRLGRAPV